MNRQRWILVATVLLIGLLGSWWWKSRSAATAPKYRTAEVDRGSIESVVSATGTIRPVVQVEIGSQVSGTVENGSNAGNLSLRFRSEVAGTAVTVLRGSWWQVLQH